ncbi:MAG: outer membrane protein assembly factor BamA [Calditrichaeota bacterium]|nr:outer membrane protein assembly factor BamA [Calditrichota bacterium]
MSLRAYLSLPLTLLLLLLHWQPLVAAGREELKLLGVSVEGNERTDAGLIIASSGLVTGEYLTGEQVQNAIRSLWQLDLFSDVQILADEATSSGVFLLVKVVEYPRLEFVDISGGKKLDKDELEKSVHLSKGSVVRPSDPVKLRNRIRKLAADKGYLLADIDIRIEPGTSPQMRNLKIRISEGKKVRIKAIEFRGNEAFPDRTLRKKFKETKQRGWFRSGEFKREKFDEDLKLLTDFYREEGYRDFEVVGDSIRYTEDLKRMFIDIEVSEGRRYYFGDITFIGGELFDDEMLQSQLLYRTGDVFNQKKFDMTVSERLNSLYYDRGYIFAQVQPRLVPHADSLLDIHYFIDPGNRFSVRRIIISGNTKTREKVIRREFSLKPGDTFDVSKLRRSVRDVTILNFFEKVLPDVEDVSKDEVDLYVKVAEKPTDQANVSAGYSERDGLIGAIGFTAPNLFGTGQQLNLDWNFGTRYTSFQVGWTEPWLFDTETLVGLSFYSIRRRWIDGFTENLIGGSTRFGRRLRWPDDYFRGDWIYRAEQAKYTEFSESFKSRNEQGIVEGKPRIASSITQIFTRDSRDFPEFPTAGSVATLTTELAGGPLTGDDRYHKHILSLDWYSPIRSKVVLYNNVQFGYLDALTSNTSDIPLLKYFYMGGGGLSVGTPLRGYDERSVGPSSAVSGYALGGRSQFKTSAELRFQIVENPTIYGLTFWEAGNTWRFFRQTDPFDLRRSAGFGVRFYMPLIGLIGFDYGYGFDYFDQSGSRRGRWTPHFQFGRQF